MSDDEEVVLRNSELYNYMRLNDIDLQNDVVDRESISSLTVVDTNLRNDYTNVPYPCNKCKVSKHVRNIIYTIISTGLLFPDHEIDLENYVEIGDVKEVKMSKSGVTINCSCLIASSSIFVILTKQCRVTHLIGLAAVAIYFGYKVSTTFKECYDYSKIKRFTSTIEYLFVVIKKTLSFIAESEFLLRRKIVKGHSFYVPNSGWVNLKTSEGLNNSGLIVPELRKLLLSFYLDLINMFDRFIRYMKETVPLKLNIDSDIFNLRLLDEYYHLKNHSVLIPDVDDLKKINKMYLVIQSECLRRLILCFVDELWLNKSFKVNLVLFEMTGYVDKLNSFAWGLESLYQKNINLQNNDTERNRGNGSLKLRDANDKFYTFVNDFLTKADAHMLSILLDLRMINDWILEFKDNNEISNIECRRKLVETLHSQLLLMNSNIQCFNNLYNDNCNILKSMINSSLDNNLLKVESISNKSFNNIKPTGIEVGKSSYDITGEDEVLISLSNTDCVSAVENLNDTDYEDQLLRKCLPGNVLDELKFALKGKKEEWIEREKKATLNTGVTIDTLDCDNLFKSDDRDYKNKTTHFEQVENSMDEPSNMYLHENLSEQEKIENKHTKELQECLVGRPLVHLFTNNSINELEKKVCESSNPSAQTFINEIKLAQRSFNLNITEDEVLEDSGSEDEIVE